MFHTLVVPLDGSSLAERALPYAIRLAQSSRGRLILMRAALAPAPGTIDGSSWEREQVRAMAEAEDYLRDMATSVAGQVSVETVAAYGRAATQILETARSFLADAVVIATHGRTGLPHLLYGSVTEAVLANCIVPVFVVHSRPGEPTAPSFAPYSARVLVPQDASALDAAAVHAALELVGVRGEIVLTTVVKHNVRLQALDYLNGIARGLRERPRPFNVNVTTDVRIGEPASEIMEAAADQRADVIVMATHGRTGIRRALIGSIAGTVMRCAPTPVLLVHPHIPGSSSHSPRLVRDLVA